MKDGELASQRKKRETGQANGQSAPNRYFILHKPYHMVSQFVSSHAVPLLGDLHFELPPGIHAVGRLDNHSEGLLILTTNKKVTRLLFESKPPHKRTYLALVDHIVTPTKLQELRDGVRFRVRGGGYYTSVPCQADIVENPKLPYESPYIMTPHIPYTWLRISLTEGKFHQVRKMITAIQHRCKRLIRVSIEGLELGDLQPGSIREIEEGEFFKLLLINPGTAPY